VYSHAPRTSITPFDQPKRFAGAKGYEDYSKMGDRIKDIPDSVRHEGFAKNALWGTPEQITQNGRTKKELVNVHFAVLTGA
jgi:hypothetical protein